MFTRVTSIMACTHAVFMLLFVWANPPFFPSGTETKKDSKALQDVEVFFVESMLCEEQTNPTYQSEIVKETHPNASRARDHSLLVYASLSEALVCFGQAHRHHAQAPKTSLRRILQDCHEEQAHPLLIVALIALPHLQPLCKGRNDLRCQPVVFSSAYVKNGNISNILRRQASFLHICIHCDPHHDAHVRVCEATKRLSHCDWQAAGTVQQLMIISRTWSLLKNPIQRCAAISSCNDDLNFLPSMRP